MLQQPMMEKLQALKLQGILEGDETSGRSRKIATRRAR
jgi:hypothetical protein